MRLKIVFGTFFVLSGSISCVGLSSAVPSNHIMFVAKKASKMKEALRKRFTFNLQEALEDAVMGNGGFGGGIFRIATSKKVLWEGAAGFISGGNSPEIKKHMSFEIASITKTFTAATIMMLFEEHKLNTTDTIDKYLPLSVVQGLSIINGIPLHSQITIEHLLTHTSGLPDYWYDPPYLDAKKGNAFLLAFLGNDKKFWEPLEIISYAKKLTTIHEPGGEYHYSDSNYLLLGLIIEQIEKFPLHIVYQRRFFKPLKMEDSYLSYREKPRSKNLITHRFEGDFSLYEKNNQSADWAGGGIVSTTEDLSKFLFALVSGKLFRFPDTFSKMQQWVSTGKKDDVYGFGLHKFTYQQPADLELIGHDGHGNSFMLYWPAKDVAFIGTLNQLENEWDGLIQEALNRIYAELSETQPTI